MLLVYLYKKIRIVTYVSVESSSRGKGKGARDMENMTYLTMMESTMWSVRGNLCNRLSKYYREGEETHVHHQNRIPKNIILFHLIQMGNRGTLSVLDLIEK